MALYLVICICKDDLGIIIHNCRTSLIYSSNILLGDQNFQWNGQFKVSTAGSSSKVLWYLLYCTQKQNAVLYDRNSVKLMDVPNNFFFQGSSEGSFRDPAIPMTSTSASVLSSLHLILQQNSLQRVRTEISFCSLSLSTLL